MSSTGRQCKATTKAGRRCASYAVDGSSFCFWHCPEKADDRKRARSTGGRARHGRDLRKVRNGQGVRLVSLADVVKVLEGELGALLVLETSVSRARAVGYLASVAVKALQVSELEARIDRLEARLGV